MVHDGSCAALGPVERKFLSTVASFPKIEAYLSKGSRSNDHYYNPVDSRYT